MLARIWSRAHDWVGTASPPTSSTATVPGGLRLHELEDVLIRFDFVSVAD